MATVQVAIGGTVVGLIVLALTWSSLAQNGILENHFFPMADWMLGEGARQDLAYPVWGYSALLAVLPLHVLRALQVFLGAGTAAAVYHEVARFPGVPARPLQATLIFLVPWYAIMGASWPQGWSCALLTLGVLALARTLRKADIRSALVGGLFVGAAGQFRSDALVLGVACAVAGLGLGRFRWRAVRSVTVFVVATFAMMIPWMTHTYVYTGHVYATSSNGGMVAYITLGQLPNNPWGIAHRDEYATTALKNAGLDVSALSPEGDKALKTMWAQAIAEHPLAFGRKVLNNAKLVVTGGFWMGELATADPTELDVVREKVKMALGFQPNQADVSRYRAQGLWEKSPMSPGLLVSMAWSGLALIGGNLFMLLTLVGVVLLRKRLMQPELALFVVVIAAQCALVATLQYTPRHVTVFALWGAPFAATAAYTIGSFACRGLRRR